MCLHLPSLALGRCEKPQRKHSETHEEDSWVTPWRRCMQVHLQGSYLCFVWFINNAVSFVIFWLFVGPQAYLRIRYLLLQAQRMNLKLQTNRNKCWERVWWVCVHRQLSPPPVSSPLHALSKSHDAHTRELRTHAPFSCSCISENVERALMPLLLPSVPFILFPGSWFMFRLWVNTSALISLPSSPHSFFIIGEEGESTFWALFVFFLFYGFD